jgi:hypothetical protein
MSTQQIAGTNSKGSLADIPATFSSRAAGAICKVLSFLIVLPCLCLQVKAQSYSIDWYKIAGGGGTSSNGQYTVSGTIGQHDAGSVMTGGNYSLTGGFWSLAAVQTPGTPLLSIAQTAPNAVLVWWLSDIGNYKLQTNATLSSNTWVDYGSTINASGGTNSVTILPRPGNLFFRLSQ